MDLAELKATISGNEAAIIANEKDVRALRARQLEIHNQNERLRAQLPIVATANDQTISNGEDTAAWLKRQSVDTINKLKDLLK